MKKTIRFTRDTPYDDYRDDQDEDIRICEAGMRKLFECRKEDLEDEVWITLSSEKLEGSYQITYYPRYGTVDLGRNFRTYDLYWNATREIEDFIYEADLEYDDGFAKLYVLFEVMA